MVRFVVVRLAWVAGIVVLTGVFAFGGVRLLEGKDLGGTVDELRLALLHLQIGPPCTPGSACEPVAQQWALGRSVDLVLVLSGLVVGPAVGLRVGSRVVARGDRLAQTALNGVAAFALSVQPYLAGYGLLLLFDGAFGVLPLPQLFPADSALITPDRPWEFARVLLGPALLIALPGFAVCYRLTLATAREVADEDFVRTAIATGLTPRQAIARDTRPIARVAVVSFVGGSVPFFVLSLVLVEYALNLPGFFKEFADASGLAPSAPPDQTPDYPTMQGVALWAALLVGVVSAVADLVLYRLDPRLRTG